ncbi:MAG TPA: DUF423 domain-containing protein [Caulobacteraceae bacterium]
MRWTRRTWMTLAALSGFLSVAFGAFAAHWIKDPKMAEVMRTGATYEFMHAVATMACATFMQVGAQRARIAPGFFLTGSLLFSGSLYALALGAPRIVGILTPFGGVLFLGGWLVLAWAALQVDQPAAA